MTGAQIDTMIARLEVLPSALHARGNSLDAVALTDAIAILRLWRAALVELSTKVHYQLRDAPLGESATRRVQGIAAAALRGERS